MEILNGLEAEGRDPLLREAADAYRTRAKILRASGRADAGETDVRRAANLEAEAKKLVEAGVPRKEAKPDLRELSKRVGELQKKLDRTLAELRGSSETRANYGPATGRIELVNAWAAPVTVIVDGTTYPMQPGGSLRLTHAAGPFTYEVRDIQARTVRQLQAGETFTIRVGPR